MNNKIIASFGLEITIYKNSIFQIQNKKQLNLKTLKGQNKLKNFILNNINKPNTGSKAN